MNKDVLRDRAQDLEEDKIVFTWELDSYFYEVSTSPNKISEYNEFQISRRARYCCVFCNAKIFVRNLGSDRQTCFFIQTRGSEGESNELKCTGSCRENESKSDSDKVLADPRLRNSSDPSLLLEMIPVNELIDEETIQEGYPIKIRSESTKPSSGNSCASGKTSVLVRVVQYFLQDPEIRKQHPLIIKSEDIRKQAKNYADYFTFMDCTEDRSFYKKHIYFGHLHYKMDNALEVTEDNIIINVLAFKSNVPIRLVIDKNSLEWAEDRVRSFHRHVRTAYKHMDELKGSEGEKGYITIFALVKPSDEDNRLFNVEKYKNIYILGTDKALMQRLKKSVNPMGTFVDDKSYDLDEGMDTISELVIGDSPSGQMRSIEPKSIKIQELTSSAEHEIKIETSLNIPLEDKSEFILKEIKSEEPVNDSLFNKIVKFFKTK
jgi:hypothetical protein